MICWATLAPGTSRGIGPGAGSTPSLPVGWWSFRKPPWDALACSRSPRPSSWNRVNPAAPGASTAPWGLQRRSSTSGSISAPPATGGRRAASHGLTVPAARHPSATRRVRPRRPPPGHVLRLPALLAEREHRAFHADGRKNLDGGHQSTDIFLGECLVLASTMLYAGEGETGLEIARQLMETIVLKNGRAWDMPAGNPGRPCTRRGHWHNPLPGQSCPWDRPACSGGTLRTPSPPCGAAMQTG